MHYSVTLKILPTRLQVGLEVRTFKPSGFAVVALQLRHLQVRYSVSLKFLPARLQDGSSNVDRGGERHLQLLEPPRK